MNTHFRLRPAFWAWLLFGLLIAGCAPLAKVEQPQTTAPLALQSGERLGQTFTVRYAGLAGISLFIQPIEPSEGELVLRVYRQPGDTEPLRTVSLPAAEITTAGYHPFNFTPITGSTPKDYYLEMEFTGSGQVQVQTGPADSYLQGALYLDQQPVPAQAAFRLIYDANTAYQGLAREGLTWLAYLLAALWLFAVPGWGLLASFWHGWHTLRLPEKLGLAVGVSLGVYPILVLWTHLIGLNLGWLYAWLPPIAGLGFWIWKRVNSRSAAQPHLSYRISWDGLKELLPDLAFILVAGLVVFSRFWPLRNIDVPMWGDSYQHSLIVKLILDHGGLFRSWEPYASLQTFTYHFGFHTQTAAFSWLTGLPAFQAVLWMGQILNVLAALALAPLAARISRSPWAAALVALTAGLMSPMPMYYVNWGRYTQLAAQSILPAAILFAWMMLESRTMDRRLAILAALTWGGLALTHYRILIFAILFLPAAFIVFGARRSLMPMLRQVLVLGFGAGIIFLPWFWRVFGGRLLSIFAVQASTPARLAGDAALQSNTIGNLTQYLPAGLWLLLVLALAWGLWRREQGAALMGVWWLLNLLAAQPHWIGLPGLGIITSLTVMIAMYFPAAIVLGAAGTWMIEAILCRLQLHRRQALSTVFSAGLLFIMLGTGALGLHDRLHDVELSTHALAARPDLKAAAWIQANTPTTARFLVDSFYSSGSFLVSGSDGGWWLPLLANRQTNLPPLVYGSEQGPTPEYVEQVNALTAAIQEVGIGNEATLSLLHQRGFTHVYIGQQQGRVSPAGPSLKPEELLASPAFRPVYHQDRVWIFELVPSGET